MASTSLSRPAGMPSCRHAVIWTLQGAADTGMSRLRWELLEIRLRFVRWLLEGVKADLVQLSERGEP
jgi:hypothetical protein